MTTNLFGKVWALMILALIVLESFFLGFDAARGEVHSAIADGILLTLWVFAAVYFHIVALREQKIDFEFDQHKKSLDDSFKKLIDGLKKDTEDRITNANALNQAHQDTIGDRAAKPSEFKRVEAKFHELTGQYLKLEVVKGDKRPSATINDKPFDVQPTAKKHLSKKPVAKKVPTKKTVTAKKGK